MSRKVSWGVLSVANIGVEKVIPGMQGSALCSIDAIASRDLGRAKDVAAKLKIAKAYGSYDELLKDPTIEAIYNPLPNELHMEWSIKALEAGKHVLCEKPIAMDSAEARKLADAAKATGKNCSEAFMVRFHPQWRRARDIVRSGEIGPVRAIQSFFSYFLTDPTNIRNIAPGGGALYDIGCYPLLTARFIFDADPSRIVTSFDWDPNFKTDRLVSALAEFPGGRHLTFTAATQSTPYQRVVIVGEKGRIEIEVPFNAPPDRVVRIRVDNGKDLFGGGARVEEFPIIDQYGLQGDAFSKAILDGAKPEFDANDAVINMRIIEAAFRSGKSGAWEKV
jgi:predicted dehydrogenase